MPTTRNPYFENGFQFNNYTPTLREQGFFLRLSVCGFVVFFVFAYLLKNELSYLLFGDMEPDLKGAEAVT
jgi:hypothetical protein